MTTTKKQAGGVTLIELILAIGIISAMAVGLNSLIDQAGDDTRGVNCTSS